MFLAELGQPVANIPGLGPAAVKSLASIGIKNVSGLLRHYPVRYEDRQTEVLLAASSAQKPACTVATVIEHSHIRWKKGLALKIRVADESAHAFLLCFGRNFLASKLPEGCKIRLSGPFERNSYGDIQSANFVFEKYNPDETGPNFGRILPVYPLAGSLTQTQLRKAMENVINSHLRGIRNELPENIRTGRGFPDKSYALEVIHFPPGIKEAELARKALIFEELFHLQLTVARRRPQADKTVQDTGNWSDNLVAKLIKSLPFELTADQMKTLEDIRADVISGTASRLIQGEVGSGKTLVAFLGALGVISAGGQAAFMAPTELLARQHADNAHKLLSPLGVRTAFLSGDVSASSRKLIVEALSNGEIDFIAGTHALFGKDISFKNLTMAIIDEQQRFGVDQRRMLAEKGNKPVNILALTATPIPRTLALTAFGDMDVSAIHTMPSGRLPIETHLTKMGNEAKVYDFVRRELENKHQAYFVYPLIEESDKSSLKDAENMYSILSEKIFPDIPSALIHSRIEEETKKQIMNKFRDGEIRILVATSVVEVGVDVPQATCMVIEHAERFGLSALHQLRGRVGRGKDKSYCFLIYSEPLSEEGKKRMKIMKEINDGFLLSEEDMKIRGPGNMAGTQQSGFLKLSIADPVRDIKVLLEARDEAKKLLEEDPGLLNPENANLRELLTTAPPFDENLLAAG